MFMVPRPKPLSEFRPAIAGNHRFYKPLCYAYAYAMLVHLEYPCYSFGLTLPRSEVLYNTFAGTSLTVSHYLLLSSSLWHPFLLSFVAALVIVLAPFWVSDVSPGGGAERRTAPIDAHSALPGPLKSYQPLWCIIHTLPSEPHFY